MSELFQQYQNYILSTAAVVALAILSKLENIKKLITSLWEMVQTVAKFISDAFTESSGKASYSRIAGTFVIFKITSQSENIPEEWMTLFMVLIGYQLISGLLRDNPAILELIKARYTAATPEKKKEEGTTE